MGTAVVRVRKHARTFGVSCPDTEMEGNQWNSL